MIEIPPPKRGTPEQISLATEIVADFVSRYQSALATMTPEQVGDLRKQSAAFWVNNRKKKGMVLVRCFVDRKKIKENRRARFARSVAGITRADGYDWKVGDRVLFNNDTKAGSISVRAGTIVELQRGYMVGVKFDDRPDRIESLLNGYVIPLEEPASVPA